MTEIENNDRTCGEASSLLALHCKTDEDEHI